MSDPIYRLSTDLMTDSFDLDSSYPLTAEQIAFYRVNRFIKLRNVLSAPVIQHFNSVISHQVDLLNQEKRPINERDTYGKAFIQITNLWRRNEEIKKLVFSPRLAGIAAMLMEVDSVRLYHDQALFKEAGGGYTPWHADQYYWPLESDKSITAWIPLQETTLEMGALEFSAGSHNLVIGRDLAISDDSEAVVDMALQNGGFPHVIEPFDLGEVSFHAGWTYHRAAPNRTERTRKVMCTIYMDAEMRLKAPANEHQQLDWDVWCPGAEVGKKIETELNPVLFNIPLHK
jgi:ectoine hydroxylase-related dioxygenase (phytanoyl-CoA dioxygenase family)